MKKNLASLGTALSRDEAKKVVGGKSACQAQVMTGNGSYTVLVGLSSSDAQSWASAGQGGGHWCCDSCGSASWAV